MSGVAAQLGGPFAYGNAQVRIYETMDEMGKAAAKHAASLIREAVQQRGEARIMVATGNSQVAVIGELVKQEVDWSTVEIFHMDEYLGISADHPASFRRWIRERVESNVHAARMNYIEGDEPDINAELRRYSELLQEGPIDVA